jgi:hypothetical protein
MRSSFDQQAFLDLIFDITIMSREEGQFCDTNFLVPWSNCHNCGGGGWTGVTRVFSALGVDDLVDSFNIINRVVIVGSRRGPTIEII